MTVYPGSLVNSNTSHVIVYPAGVSRAGRTALFKYISCYCLSAELAETDNKLLAFKYISCYCLSRVIEAGRARHFRFKYISCYCLSRKVMDTPDMLAKFKYISCYCLSCRTGWMTGQIFYSNTSHVIVYLYKYSCYRCRQGDSNTSHVIVYQYSVPPDNPIRYYSNTSHVIVYRKSPSLSLFPAEIQIHLMLLFIYSIKDKHLTPDEFKYISCYCLSSTSSVSTILRKIQIHLMLLFIRGRTGAV